MREMQMRERALFCRERHSLHMSLRESFFWNEFFEAFSDEFFSCNTRGLEEKFTSNGFV